MKRVLIIALCLYASGCGLPTEFDRGATQALPSPSWAGAEEDGTLRVTVIDVGQGDAILIEAPSGEAILVDAGPPGAGQLSILPLLAERGKGEIVHAIVTHYHADHYGGLAEIAAAQIAIGGIYERREQAGEEADPLADYGPMPPCPRQALSAGDRIELGDVALEAVAANAELADGTIVDAGEPPDENAMSIVLLLEYSGFRMLLTGDLTGGGGNPPYETPDVETPLGPIVGDIDVLKVAHHGSQTSTNQAFLDATAPEVAIISTGDGNDYSHPHDSVTLRLLDSGIAIYQTERGWLDIEDPVVASGDVTIEVDGDGEYRVVLE